MRNPRLPAAWLSPKGAIIGTVFAGALAWFGFRVLDAFGLLLLLPFIATALTVPIIVVLEWATGRGQRAYRFGTGRQHVWGYCGHDIRGIVDGDRIWVSVRDCENASGLDLSRGLKAVPSSRRRVVDVHGLILDMPAMLKVLDNCGEDFSSVGRLRAFLERSVWMTKKG